MSPSHLNLTDQLSRRVTLSGTLPSRAWLRADAVDPQATPLRLHALRTLPLDWVASVMDPFLSLWGRRLVLSQSGYDPALTEPDVPPHPVEGFWVWLDWRLYHHLSPQAAVSWLAGRLELLRAESPSIPVWLNDWPTTDATGSPDPWAAELNAALTLWAEATPETYCLPLADWGAAPLAWDPRNDARAGTPFSEALHRQVAQAMALDALPGVLHRPVKWVILDLDDTLAAGVLGEVGPAGMQLRDGHRAFQDSLVALHKRGVLLTLCTHNDPADVAALWTSRPDWPLRPEHLAAQAVGWEDKATGVARLSEQLRLSPADAVMVDDQPAQLLRLMAAYPGLQPVLAEPADPARTQAQLRHTPGLWRPKATREDTLRQGDLQALTVRRAGLDLQGEAYLASLEMRLDIAWKPVAQAARIAALSQRTNQFNLCFARWDEATVVALLRDPDVWLMTAALADRLSDSGVVVVWAARRTGPASAQLIEGVVSCRALGRHVETATWWAFLSQLASQGVETLSVAPVAGPRNAPALSWWAQWPEGGGVSAWRQAAASRGAPGWFTLPGWQPERLDDPCPPTP